MTPEFLFRAGSEVAVVGWLALILAGNVPFVRALLCKLVLPGLIASAYTAIVCTHWSGHQGGFDSIQAVQQLFGDPWLLTAGWLHYLAFDLFVGGWQVRDAQRSSISRWLTLPCLVGTFLFGPAGFLLYLLLKAVHTRAIKQRTSIS